MKRVFLGCIATCLPFASANAQSSITFSGSIDQAISYVQHAEQNGASRLSMKSGQYAGSTWGFNGSEELGGSLKAVFTLLGSFNAMNGQSGVDGTLFDYMSLVGLTSEKFGTFKLGRTYAIDNGVYDFDPFVQQVWSSATLVEGRNWNIANNTANYWSPNWQGFDVYVQLGLGNSVGWNRGLSNQYGRTDGIQLTYTGSSVQFRAIYDEMRDADGKYSDIFLYSKEAIATANVFIKDFTLRMAYSVMWADPTDPMAPHHAEHSWLGVTYRGIPATGISAAIYHYSADGDASLGGGSANMMEAGATYELSKRTMIYLTGAWMINSRNTRFALAPNGVASVDNPPVGESQRGAYIGIHHTF
jgi:predicted porin